LAGEKGYGQKLIYCFNVLSSMLPGAASQAGFCAAFYSVCGRPGETYLLMTISRRNKRLSYQNSVVNSFFLDNSRLQPDRYAKNFRKSKECMEKVYV